MVEDREFFIFGEEWSLYEDIVPIENFTFEEIQAVACKKYHYTENNHYYISQCPVSIRERKIPLKDLEAQFAPWFVLTEQVVSCEQASSPDYEVLNAFALVYESAKGRCHNALYGSHENGIITELYGAGLRPLSNFSISLAPQLAQFCKKNDLLLLLHNEYVLDIRDPNQLLDPNNKQYD